MNSLDEALKYQAEGKPIFPVDRATKRPLVEWKPFQSRLPTETEVLGWESKWLDANVGMATGKLSGLVVVDCDGDEARASFMAQFPEAKNTKIATTGRGVHFYFQWADGIRNSSGKLGAGIDVRAEGGYVVVPPSIHANGKPYASVNENPPIPLPSSLREALNQSTPAATPERAIFIIPEGERNSTLTSIAGFLRRKGLDAETIGSALGVINKASCYPPLAAHDVEQIARSVARYPSPIENTPSTLECQTMVELFAETDEPPAWLWQGIIERGDVVMIAADAKAGKSTFLGPLIVAMLRGNEFLGYPMRQCKIMLALEEAPKQVARRLKKLGVTKADSDIIRIKQLTLPGDVDKLIQTSNDFKADVVIIDTMATFFEIESENDNAEMAKALKSLSNLAHEHNISVIIAHHSASKGKAIRGATAIFAALDQSIHLRKPKTKNGQITKGNL